MALELFFGCFIDALRLIYEFRAERAKMNMLSCSCSCHAHSLLANPHWHP